MESVQKYSEGELANCWIEAITCIAERNRRSFQDPAIKAWVEGALQLSGLSKKAEQPA